MDLGIARAVRAEIELGSPSRLWWDFLPPSLSTLRPAFFADAVRESIAADLAPDLLAMWRELRRGLIQAGRKRELVLLRRAA